MDKIFEMLGVEKLDESKQDKLKDALQAIVETKASEMSEAKVDELLESKKEELVEEYETKFDTYTTDITEKFSNFVDDILEKEMIIPENVLRFAHLGELYESLIEQFKVRLAIDEGMIEDEVKSRLKEANDEIAELRSTLDEVKGKNLEMDKDCKVMSAGLYLRSKCDGLTESQKKHVINILGDELVKETIDKRFDYIIESIGVTLDESDDKGEDESDDKGEDEKVTEMECPKCGNIDTVKEGEKAKCSECGASLKEKKDDKKVEESTKEQAHKLWLDVMKKSKF